MMNRVLKVLFLVSAYSNVALIHNHLQRF